MTPDQSKYFDRLILKISDEINRLEEAGHLNKIKELIKDSSKGLGKEDIFEVNFDFNYVSGEKETHMNLAQHGYWTGQDGELVKSFGGDAFLKYWVDGSLIVVPNSYCPACFREWDFKEIGESCHHCDAEMGSDVKHFIDDDICPHCGDGQITQSQPECTQCDYKVDPRITIWG